MKAVNLVLLIAVSAIAVMVCCFALSSDNNGNQPKDDEKSIGIIGAMSEEVETLIEATDVKKTETIADMEFFIGKLHDTNVVIVQSGIGKVNSGICAQMLISHFGVDYIINTGVAGSLDEELDIGDIVVSSDTVQHDFDVSPIGYQKGEIPYTGKYAFEADPVLIELAESAVEVCAPDLIQKTGRVCSGDQFIASEEQKERILSDFGGLCCEMEGGSIGLVCYLNEVPYVVIRAMSDRADGTGPEDYEEFEKIAAILCANIVEYMISQM